MTPEHRLRRKEQGRAKRRVVAHPTYGELIKSPDAEQECEEVDKVLHVYFLHSRKYLCKRLCDDSSEHHKKRTVVLEAIPCDRNRPMLQPGSISFERIRGVVVELHFIPRLAVIVECK